MKSIPREMQNNFKITAVGIVIYRSYETPHLELFFKERVTKIEVYHTRCMQGGKIMPEKTQVWLNVEFIKHKDRKICIAAGESYLDNPLGITNLFNEIVTEIEDKW